VDISQESPISCCCNFCSKCVEPTLYFVMQPVHHKFYHYLMFKHFSKLAPKMNRYELCGFYYKDLSPYQDCFEVVGYEVEGDVT
jgi:hypothetical protein